MTRLIALLLLSALPAGALIPEPLCGVDEETGLIWPTSDPRAIYAVWPAFYPGQVVTFDWIDEAERVHGYVLLCQTGDALRWSIPATREEAMRPRYYEMLEGDTVHTLGDIGRMIRGAGGRATRAASPGACACESVGF